MDESYSLATISLPDHSIEKLLLSNLPLQWKKVPPPAALADIGRKFVAAGRFLALEVPSVLVPYEFSLVINSQHPLIQQVRIEAVEEIYPDERLIAKPAK
jgi:hypothetical protein